MLERNERSKEIKRELSKEETEKLTDLEIGLTVYYQWYYDNAEEEIDVDITSEISLKNKD